MKNKMKTYKYMILLILSAIILNSCGDIDEERSPLMKLITFNIYGNEQYIFQIPLLSVCDGNISIIAMNDNKRFILCSQDLHIANTEDGSFETFLRNITIDNGSDWPTGIESIGLSYDDNYLAFTSEHHLYCLDLFTNEYELLTLSGYDLRPKFGIDNRIYFVRKDEENSTNKLMRIEVTGTQLTEICEHVEVITHVFPGQVDSNTIYFVTDVSQFCMVNIENATVTELYVFPTDLRVVSRTNDDRYFIFNNTNEPRYFYDTETNLMEIIDYPYLSKVLPNAKQAISRNINGAAIIRIWDIETLQLIGETIELNDTVESGLPYIAITPDGIRAAIVHKAY